MLRKGELLPLQGKLWKCWGKLNKEQKRNKISEIPVEVFVDNKKKLELIREEQFKLAQTELSFACKIALQLKENNPVMNRYLIAWIELYLNNCSKQIKKQIRQKGSHSLDQGTENDLLRNSYRKFVDDIKEASFEIEDIIREFGQLFEAVDSYMTTHSTRLPEQQVHILKLPHIVADLMLQGMPFELMDGDTSFVPLTWVEAVFREIRKLVGDKKLFIVSVIGTQGSGKSFLLNTMFGLKFSVSAGRCTKGLQCIMVPADKQALEVEYDYILVIDTEGLRAPEMEVVDQMHDNELAIFVMGLSDVTIVNIKGESLREINDILSIVIYAMVRMYKGKPNLLRPSCFFVHQTISHINADVKMKWLEESILQNFDEITARAAKVENVANIKCFEDIISYDECRFAYYVPDLWQGQPPMAAVSKLYGEKAKQIRNFIINKKRTNTRQLIPLTITQFIERMGDLWNAILNENFVFSFRNSEEIQVFSRLERVYAQLCCNLKEASLQLEILSTTAVQSAEDEEQLKQHELHLKNRIDSDLRDQCNSLQTQLEEYFEKNEDICSKYILEQWRDRYKMKLDSLCQDERNRISGQLSENVSERIAHLETSDVKNTVKRD